MTVENLTMGDKFKTLNRISCLIGDQVVKIDSEQEGTVESVFDQGGNRVVVGSFNVTIGGVNGTPLKKMGHKITFHDPRRQIAPIKTLS